MSIEAFTDAVSALDASPPVFQPLERRRKAFLQIGEFFEGHIREGGPFDLKRHAQPLWKLLKPRLQKAIREAVETDHARDDVTLWQLYNDGVLLRTGEVVIGLDVIPVTRTPGWEDHADLVEELAATMDVLLITHPHADHYDKPLVRACLTMGKPVILPEPMAGEWERDPNLHAAHHGWELDLCDLHLTARHGIHIWRESLEDVPLAYYEVRCQRGFTFLFCGDLDYTKLLEKTPGAKVDLLFLPWRSPNESYEEGAPHRAGSRLDAVKIALKRIQPGRVLFEHYAELDHIYDGLPASYDMALELQRQLPVPAELLFWGEKVKLA